LERGERGSGPNFNGTGTGDQVEAREADLWWGDWKVGVCTVTLALNQNFIIALRVRDTHTRTMSTIEELKSVARKVLEVLVTPTDSKIKATFDSHVVIHEHGPQAAGLPFLGRDFQGLERTVRNVEYHANGMGQASCGTQVARVGVGRRCICQRTGNIRGEKDEEALE
jgi:hypothetical protein